MLDAVSEVLSGRAWWVYIIVFVAEVIEVTLSTLRTSLVVKGEKIPGALIAAVQHLIWVVITATILVNFTADGLKIIVLIVAFALGRYLGACLDERLALGVCTINAVFQEREKADEAAERLRNEGCALTMVRAQGIENEKRTVIMMTLKSRNVEAVKSIIHKIDPHAVICTVQSVSLDGGTMPRQIK
ncbi:MAG: DUF5698 domain-containing protein [Sphaerochaetaceae bacterium]|jgi:uncharacterized protein YebE (UPF0316 family)|nr:DUF5698 domain-containing protein [Sphaerochaetaceae bacterium]NLY08180.1 DUF2179 domain-containing protein [Spirochaetales bacterium]